MKISDTSVRQAIRNEKSRSVVVEASAGTGKTTLITERVNALVEGGIPLTNLAVVTFTEAAASELRTRIRETLSPDNKRAMDQAWITTIHGFASRILREYFHLTGGVPEFSMEVSHFSRAELEIHWDLFLSEADPAVLRLSSESLKNPGSRKLLDIAEEIEKHRWFTDSKPLGNTEDELLKTINLCCKRLSSLTTLCSDQSDKLLQEIQKSILSLNDGSARKVSLRGGSSANWGGKESLVETKQILRDYNKLEVKLIEAYSTMIPLLPAIDGLVIPFVNKLRALWDKDPTRLSFDDLLHRAWASLASSSDLKRELNQKFNHIFIDEFQDTSLIQVKLFVELLGKTGLASKLTVVGDPKQSIFGWRSADIETYKDTLKRLEENDALSENIEVNFRSDKSVIDFVNTFGKVLFSQISAEEEPFSCSYSPILPRPNSVEGGGVTVHRLPDLKAGEMASLEAAAIADLVEDPGSTAVLFRSGTHLDSLVQALDRKGIPYRVEASRDFHKRKEVEDTANLLKTILCPSDSFAMAETLRSIFFGISDKDITLWRTQEKPESIKEAEILLDKLRMVAKTLPPAHFLETLFRNTCLLPAVIESGYQVTRRLGNLRFILETASRTDDYALLLESLLGEAPMSAEEPSAPPENHTGVLTLTTIHRAKGLAWEHVILANPGKSVSNSPPDVLTNDRDLSAGIKTAGGLTALYDGLTRREKARSRAEYRRLLYVAVTRPKRKLDIFLPAKSVEGSPAATLSSALALSTDFFREETVSESDQTCSGKKQNTGLPKIGNDDEFKYLYPESLPLIDFEREKQMRLGTEVHRILELINFEKPDEWLAINRPGLQKSLEFPEEAIALSAKFFKVFDLKDAEIVGREYPLLTQGRQYYIDLLILRNGVYEVIDYKTDREPVESRIAFYRNKQLLYKKTMEEITGREVKVKLVFLHHGKIIEIK